MTKDSVEIALLEAKRFIKRVMELEASVDPQSTRSTYSAPKESGAVRRASMDLTRALAAMRKSS